jgi:lipid A disaccharide synthetase
MVLIDASSRFFTFFKTSAYTLKNTADERSASLIFVDHQSINLRVRAQMRHRKQLFCIPKNE